ncbi:MAG TPA: FAD-binding and (Fe-S)-binding domain-containing protein [Verrucomicrobiae bacterium]|jgi:D-lactate dehydrogenase|uniref:FAD-binding and (Fe-S)-binding domain-containing protein n=1 Tax=Bradyrhizobium sp. TaxID=376 RepID=UPI002BAEBDEF|nr:FAD-binding and (Fe-S)-binding domain-containing protein [Verrucomicrobiae bacterium]
MRKLFSVNPARIGRFEASPKCDAVSASLVGGTPGDLKADLIALLGKQNVLHRAIDLVRYASDASPYRLIPQVVVLPRTSDDIVKLFRYCRENGRHATFRAAGTSLNGQSLSDDILIDVRRHWYGAKVEDDGRRVRARPGMVLGHVNAMLGRYGRRVGPDPASSHACTIGGVIANNSGGMRCTVRNDAYQTVSAMTFVTPSGAVIDTSAPEAEAAFERAEPDLAIGLLELRGQLLADRELADRVRRKYVIRNTHGYRLCALLDGETPLEIFRRLLVGSEGTLAFVAEAVIDTVPLPSVTSVAWIPVPTIDEAVGLVSGLVGLGASAVELMVAPALTAAGQAFAQTPSYWKTLDPKAASLLVEFGAEDMRALEILQDKVIAFTSRANLIHPVEFTSVEEAIELAWHVREGLLGLVGKHRPEGSTLITEDVCFPPERLAQGAKDLQELLSKHGFIPGVAGHAAHGNLHFTLVADFGDPESKKRYAAFMEEVVDLVVRKYNGSLKAEHGTGLNMAPFVESEWGAKATAMMWRIKELADPQGILGPNVILTRNAKLHLENLKSVPQIESVTGSSQCIECGFCEPVCPSRNITMTPRQRIVLRREMARQSPGSPMLARLQQEYQYDGIETCAGDGTCAIPCPIGINTGALIREFRAMETTATADKVALGLARSWSTVEKVSRASLSATHAFSALFGVKPLTALTGIARAVANPDLIPSVPGPMPRAARAPRSTQKNGAAAVYFPACINRMFGRDPDSPASPYLPEAFVTLSERAGKPLWIPPDVAGLCCSTPWKSKGYPQGHGFMAKSIAEAMLRWSDGGKLPIVVDAASCTLGLSQDIAPLLDAETKNKYERLSIIDSIAWCRDLLPKLTIRRKLGRIAVHPTCSITHLQLAGTIKQIATHLAEEVEVPIGTTCCGTAGDRGLLHPELVVSATREVKAILDAHPAEAYISANRTCEMGLRHATGRPYESFVFLLEELSRPEEG